MDDKVQVSKHSPEKIVEILHSISKIEIDGDELNIYFDNDLKCPEVLSGFEYGSFTRNLLELIDDHLLG